MFEKGVFLVGCFQIEGDEARNPVVAVNYVGGPAKFADSFNHSFTEEYGTFVVVFVKAIFLIVKYRFPMKIIFVVNKLNLQFSIGHGSPLDDERFLFVADQNINPGKTNPFMKPIFSLIDKAEARH